MSADLARRLGAKSRQAAQPAEAAHATAGARAREAARATATVPPRAAARPVVTPQPGATVRPGATAARPGATAARPGSGAVARRSGSAAVERITVPVRVHIIRDRTLGLPDAAVSRQIAVLNTAYSGGYGGADTGVRFELKGITHTENRNWFRDPLGYEEPMKKKLRVGGPETLNLYIAQLSRLVLGYSTYPYWYDDEPVLDGVVIDWRSVPGGPLRDFARGFTAVHEIGHWLGLLHTFENGCKAPGDSVDDTPPEAHPTNGCPAKKDSCPAPGSDPVHNFMDYAQDRCMREFTAGQGVRVHQMWDAYRRPAPLGTGAASQKAATGVAAAGVQGATPATQGTAAEVADGADAADAAVVSTGAANDLDAVSVSDTVSDTANGTASDSASDPGPGIVTRSSEHPAGDTQGDERSSGGTGR
ncbi:zinc metalloprotease [Microbispora hainanensis]|uniref:Zinc metalloprotease n=2 Tax=Microbispora hainanensis TaxID=568844 RepID=A0A544YX86_9ACTN|nr:zinc metalloprotease [Microbispora hainanensis]